MGQSTYSLFMMSNAFKLVLLAVGLFAFSKQIVATEIPKIFDSGVNGLLFYDTASTLGHLKRTTVNRKAFGFYYHAFTNKERAQKITLINHPGSDINSISEVLVEKTSESKLPVLFDSKCSFITSKGVALGISIQKLIALMGKPDRAIKNVYFYKLEGNHFLRKKYNMPIYYGRYEFERGELTKFKFGFEYP